MSAQDNLGKQFVTVNHGNESRIVHTDKKGKIKYYTTHGYAWDAANKLNDKGQCLSVGCDFYQTCFHNSFRTELFQHVY